MTNVRIKKDVWNALLNRSKANNRSGTAQFEYELRNLLKAELKELSK